RIIRGIRMVAAMDCKPLALCRCLPVIPRHPGYKVALGVHRWRLASFVEQQELLGLDAHAAPAERACVAELRAVPAVMGATKHALELVGAQCDEDRRQLGRVEVTEAHGEAELAPGFRRLESERAAVVLLVRVGGILCDGIGPVEIELAAC